MKRFWEFRFNVSNGDDDDDADDGYDDDDDDLHSTFSINKICINLFHYVTIESRSEDGR